MPTVIKLYVDSGSASRLNEYLTSNELPPRARFHSTIFYANETPVFQARTQVDIASSLPISTANPLKPEVFADNLVLLYDHAVVRDLNGRLYLDAVRQMIGFPDLNPNEFDILRWHREIETEFVHPSGLRVSNQRSGLVKYAEFNPHITISRVSKDFQAELLPCFEERIVFDDFSWEITPPVVVSDMAG